MSVINFYQKPATKNINPLLDEFFKPVSSRMLDSLLLPTSGGVPVNIRETAENFLLEIVAPGFEKPDFIVKVNENLLTISAVKKDESANENERSIRREFSRKAFSRTFSLDENIQMENIIAKYENGILYLELPKKVMAKIEPKAIIVQ